MSSLERWGDRLEACLPLAGVLIGVLVLGAVLA